MQLIDTHFHLELCKDYSEIIKKTEIEQIYTIAVTTIPSAFKKSAVLTTNCKYIRTALGFHPELVSSRASEIKIFEDLVRETRYIGEVGLDFSKKIDEDIKIQERVFEDILSLCANKDKIFSVHSRQAADRTVDLIGAAYPGKIIMHWFSGPLKSLSKAISSGFYFSINHSMGSSDKGTRIIKEIPPNKILLESDGPFTFIDNIPTQPSDTLHALNGLAKVLKRDALELSREIFQNFKTLLGSELGN